MEDKQLLELLHSDSKLAFDVYFKNWSFRIYRCCFTLTDSQVIAKRMVVDVFVNFWKDRRVVSVNTPVDKIFLNYIIKCLRSDYYHSFNSKTTLENEVRLEHLWEFFDYVNTPEVDNDKYLNDVKKDIDNAILFYKSHNSRFCYSATTVHLSNCIMRFFAIVMPLLFISALYYYNNHYLIIHDNILISTQNGESASVKLPDGSLIKMNGESDLIYNNSEYNKNKRNVRFTGSADFFILNSKNVFTVLTDFIRVEVNESKFSLQADKYAENTSLSLFRGKANVLSRISKHTFSAPQGCKLTVNNRTGQFSLKGLRNAKESHALYHSVP